MRFGLGLGYGFDFASLYGGGGNSAGFYADGETAPSGFHWEFVTDDTNGSRIIDDVTGQPIVDLVAN